MSSIFRLDASIRQEGSVTRAVADTLVSTIAEELGHADVVRRDVAAQPISGSVWGTAAFAGYTPEESRTEEQRAALAVSSELADELVAADALIFAVPLYNFGVSQHVKTWFDLVLAGAPHGTRLLEGKPVVLLTTRGGAYGEGTPRAGWDHSTDFLRRILVDIWGADLTVIEREFTLVGVNPALDEFTELAALMKKEAEEAAVVAGRELATR